MLVIKFGHPYKGATLICFKFYGHKAQPERQHHGGHRDLGVREAIYNK